MKYAFKPLNNMHLYFMWIFYIFPVSFFDMGCIIVFLNKFDIELLIMCMLITILPLIIYTIVRILYPYKYVVDDKYVIKYKGRKIVFKIKLEDIKLIVAKKVKFVNYIKFIISIVSYHNLSISNFTTMSFLFDKYEILIDYDCGEFKRQRVTNNKENNYKEYVEIISYKKIKKICKITNLNFKSL